MEYVVMVETTIGYEVTVEGQSFEDAAKNARSLVAGDDEAEVPNYECKFAKVCPDGVAAHIESKVVGVIVG